MTREDILKEILELKGTNWLLELATGTGKSRLANDAYISNNSKYITIGPIGNRADDYATFYLNKDKKIMVKWSRFNGTIEEFITSISNETDKKYKNQYVNTITYAKCILYNESALSSIL